MKATPSGLNIPFAGHCLGFTLPELLVVLTIIGILASMIGQGVVTAQRQARQTQCKSNLRQFGVALQIYRGEHNMGNPPWLSNLYPDYIDSKSLYICRSDEGKGSGPAKSDGLLRAYPGDNPFPEVTDNNKSGTDRKSYGANPDIQLCSYFYEFSYARNDYGWTEDHWPTDDEGRLFRFSNIDVPKPDWTWCDYKENQLRFGDDNSGRMAYSESLMPIIRCFHHYAESSKVDQRLKGGGISQEKSYITLNVAYAGSVYVGPSQWELTVQPGDRQ